MRIRLLPIFLSLSSILNAMELYKHQKTFHSPEQLFQAIKENNLNAVHMLLQKIDVNCQDKCNNTPLYVAVENGNLSIAKLLIEKGAKVNAQDIDLLTPLHEASRKANIEIMQLLIEKGADINCKDCDQETPLHYAAAVNNSVPLEQRLRAATILISKGADINASDDEEGTPLFYAIHAGNCDMVQLLISKGASIENNDPLLIAVDSDINILSFLLSKGADPDACFVDGSTPLFVACDLLDVERVMQLLKYDVDLDFTPNGRTVFDFIDLLESKRHDEEDRHKIAEIKSLITKAALQKKIKTAEKIRLVLLPENTNHANAFSYPVLAALNRK